MTHKIKSLFRHWIIRITIFIKGVFCDIGFISEADYVAYLLELDKRLEDEGKRLAERVNTLQQQIKARGIQ